MFKQFLCAALCAVTVASTSAQAGFRTYISRTGNDGNACTNPASPCATFQRGIDTAGAKGEVYCLDSAFFGFMNINFSVSVMCEDYHGQVGINQITVATGASDVVVINGIDMDHRDSPISSGVNFTGAGTLILRNSSIRNATNAINFRPNANAKLVISNTLLEAYANLGLVVAPTGTALARVDIDGLTATSGVGGVAVVAAAGATVEMDMRNSTIAQNSSYGVVGSTTGGVSVVFIEHSAVSNNGLGVFATGANSFVLVNNSSILRNSTGWGFSAGGALLSFGNNAFNNAVGGSASGTIALQ